ncbi:glutathione S-transferase C-terminal domain-containing protein [Sphingomonas oryzagri]
MFKLYYNPGSCSLAAHAALVESGLAYQIEKIDLTVAANEDANYRAINPWARVPALVTSYGVLTENIAILNFIADLVPEKNLLPRPASLEHARALEWMALLSSTVHVAFRPLFRPGRLAATEAGQADVAAVGLVNLNHVLGLLDERVGSRPFVLGADFSLVDLYLFVFLTWMQRPVLNGKLIERPNLAAARLRLTERVSVRRAMTEEGLIPAE